MGEGGLAGAGDAGEADEEAEREVGVELAAGCGGWLRWMARICFAGLAAGCRDGDGFLAGEPGEGAECE